MTELEDNGGNDRISRLPGNLIDHIMKLLPVRDAVRTCVWSSDWRYMWAEHPSLILDKKFWDDIKQQNLSNKLNIDSADIVNRLLLRHTGNIQKFVVDISVIKKERHSNIDLWLLVLCGKGVKEVSIVNSAKNAYTIPSCVFYASELSNLSISNCIINTKETLTGFNSLLRLTLNHLTLNYWILNTPLLTSLCLEDCFGVRGFNISAPKLPSLTLKSNDDFNLIPFLLCCKITYAYISFKKNFQGVGGVDFVDLVMLFNSWPELAKFQLDGSSLKYLASGIPLDDFSNVLKLKRFVAVSIDLDQATWILRIIGNSAFLKTCEIGFGKKSIDNKLNNLEALKYLEEQSIMNMKIPQVHTVKIRFFNCSKIELQFVKILLHCSPSLKQILVEENILLTTDERLKITKKLMEFQHAYAKPKIIFGSYF